MATMTITPSNQIYSNFVKNSELAKKVFDNDIHTIDNMSFTQIKKEKENMSLKDYEDYIYNKISAIDMHDSQNKFAYQIHFSEHGLKRMKTDSDYENFVLSTIKSNFELPIPKSNGGIIKLYFTENESEFKKEVIKKEDIEQKEIKEKNFWEKRAERQKKLDEKHEKKLKKEKILKARYEKSKMLEEISKSRYKRVNNKILNTTVIEMTTDDNVDAKLDYLMDFLM